MTVITVKCLNELQKNVIAAKYLSGVKIKVLAEFYMTSARTIGRVLVERGLATPTDRSKGEAYQAMKHLNEASMTPDDLGAVLKIFRQYGVTGRVQLEAALKAPALSTQNIQTYLNQCTKEQLASHFYASGLIKLAEITQANAERKKQQAALFKPATQSPLPFPKPTETIIPKFTVPAEFESKQPIHF